MVEKLYVFRDRPLIWDETLIRQMMECVKIQSKYKIAIRFRWGAEIKANFKE